ncbi:DNA-binding protein [Escherichia sp. E4742]|nr:KilA-N domain-containing protein [Escherichia sp. E4742]QCT85786.1 DNA-binding protein [Escherichia sp. E4742]TGB60235.1 DNA-binding protein [Escherichia sp. E4742]TLJ05018.1 DNA-binding protein [Escherichia sp. E4742]
MKSLTLFNQPIRIGEDGMICLTDMWKASGKSESESPYHYLRNKQTKEFLAELEKNHESVVFTERGVHGGTYGGKFVAYDYAAWLNPGFKYAAYKVLDDYFTGELQHRNSLSAQLNMKCHEFDQKKDMASFCGQGLAAWRYTKPVLVAEINSLANQHAKQQIALESQRAQEDIKVAVADDDCAVRIVPSGAVKRLHEYANGIRIGAGRSVTSQSDG